MDGHQDVSAVSFSSYLNDYSIYFDVFPGDLLPQNETSCIHTPYICQLDFYDLQPGQVIDRGESRGSEK